MELSRGHHGRVKIAELVLQYVRALVWPVVTLALVWFLRAQLRAAVARMTRVETPAGAIEFAVEARDVLNQAARAARAGQLSGDGVPVPEPVPVPGQSQQPRGGGANSPWAPPPSPSSPPPASYGGPPAPQGRGRGGGPPPTWRQELRNARDMADASPVGAVTTAWNALYALCADVLATVDHQDHPSGLPRPVDPVEVERALVSVGLSSSAVTVFTRLRQLSSRAAQGAGEVTSGAARDFVDSCLTVAREVDALRRP
jgi:hypothetical protein